MKNLKKLNENETRNINGGGNYCKICGYGNNTYKSWSNVASHILRNHLRQFAGIYGRMSGSISVRKGETHYQKSVDIKKEGIGNCETSSQS